MGDPKAITVTFSTGKDVLNAYWGFLSNGGLVIDDTNGLREGEKVALDVTITSSQKCYRLNGQVVRRPDFSAPSQLPGATSERAVIEFHPGEPHDLLLSAAWAETDNVPARRHRRYPTESSVQLRTDSGTHQIGGRLLNISMGGCCLHMANSSSSVAPGARVVLAAPNLDGGAEVAGLVRWARAADLGIEFESSGVEHKGVERFVRLFL